MGGYGSGTHIRWNTRSTVEDMNALHIGKLASGGWLRAGQTCSYSWTHGGRKSGDIRVTAMDGHVVLNYRRRANGGDWESVSYPVQIDRTPCHFGETRPWFRCPVNGCGRRVAILYGGSVFACRHCHQLAYPPENEGTRDRATRCADKLRERLQCPPGIIEGSDWPKPKHMHETTFQRLFTEYEESEVAALGEIMTWMQRLTS